ncbi:MAG: hypothetical protein PWP04_954 [Candidatus Atribacteria bacterium]|nr:hypothetical protein [Candidatus Atribacteria bacterium]
MKIVRFLHPKQGVPSWGYLKEKNTVLEINSPFSSQIEEKGGTFSLPDLKLLSPTAPSKVVAVGLNYRDHVAEFQHQIPENPIIFLKPSTAVIGPDEPILLPPSSQKVDYEGELAVVIKKPAKNVSTSQADSYILGYTCLNDVTARDLQKKDGQWTRAKSFDTFSPIGPWIETDLEPGQLELRSLVNGQIKQNASTSNLIFPVKELIAFISQVMTLLPGDIIATGTPAGVGPLKPGDTVEISIQGIGTLRNPVKKA